MSKATVRVKAVPGGGRQVIVTVPVDLCVAAIGMHFGDPVDQADRVAQEIAMHRLAEQLGYE